MQEVPTVAGEHDMDLGPISEDNAPQPPDAEVPTTTDKIPDPLTDSKVIHEPVDPNIVTGKRTHKPGHIVRAITDGEGTASFAKDLWEKAYAHAAQVEELDPYNPHTVAEAKHRPDWPHWLEAMLDEIKRLEAHHSWDFVEPPRPGVNIVDSKWVFHLKKDAHGKVTAYRA
jgi:hypothetical protein